MIWMQNPEGWKEQVYERKYNQVLNKPRLPRTSAKVAGATNATLEGTISWDRTGVPACWNEDPKGVRLKATYRDNSVVPVCDASGTLQKVDRLLDRQTTTSMPVAPIGVDRSVKTTMISYINTIFGKDAPVAYRIMMCESSGNPLARNGQNFGLFQINYVHVKRFGIKFETDPNENIRVAYVLYKEQSWSPWQYCSRGLK